MKNIAQFVRQGITSLGDLQDALQTAMQLEFSTIPPYLCAEWSIADNDPDQVADLVHGIVMQEMFHFALVGNMLAAIRGTPKIADAGFLPTYPTRTLPGGIDQQLPVDLKPLSKEQLQVFMQIETPEFPPIEIAARAAAPATIGAFYDTISQAFKDLNPSIDPNAHFVVRGSEVFRISSVTDAQNAIDRIKGEGEGAPGTPDQPVNPRQLAHFYVFKEIFVGAALTFDATLGKLVPGKPIRMPSVLPFEPSSAVPNPSIAFNKLLSQLLIDLEACWTTGAALGVSVSDMFQLQQEGEKLIGQGVRPEFAWLDPRPGTA